MRLLVIGASTHPVCGLRDHTAAIVPGLRAAGASVEVCWWDRDRAAPLGAWLAGIRTAATAGDAILWQYSPFPYGQRGLPTAIPAVLRTLRRSGLPLVPLLHEYAHPVLGHGWRGAAHGVTQHAALWPILQASRGILLTTPERVAWLERQRWLPGRPSGLVPMTSNVPVAEALVGTTDAPSQPLTIGIFGFRTGGLVPALVIEAIALAAPAAQLLLIGAPGPAAAEAAAWRAAAAAAGVTLAFTGVLPPPELSQALARIDLALFASLTGPSPRRGTIAALLAHGRPVVAVDGQHTWQALVAEEAVVLGGRTSSDLAAALGSLAANPELRRHHGKRARAFYERHLAPDATAQTILDFVGRVAT